MLLNNNTTDIEKIDGRSSPTFVVDEFLGLFLHLIFLLNVHDLHK